VDRETGDRWGILAGFPHGEETGSENTVADPLEHRGCDRHFGGDLTGVGNKSANRITGHPQPSDASTRPPAAGGTAAQPLVSVITTSYNHGRYIDACIESVLAQDYPRIEHIIQDGASADGTVEILKSYGNKTDWRSIPDSGQGEAMDNALKRCRGEIIIALNADDMLLPHAAGWSVRQMREHPDAAVVYGDMILMNEQGEDFGLFRAPDYDFAGVFCVEKVIGAQAAFFRRSMYEQVGLGSDPGMPTCPDLEMLIRMGLSFPMVHIPEAVTRYRYYHRPMDGRVPRSVKRFVEVKAALIERVLTDPKTPEAIQRLRRRATAGLYLWGSEEARGMGNIREAWRYYALGMLKFSPADLLRYGASHALQAHGDKLAPAPQLSYTPNLVRARDVGVGLIKSTLHRP
jgi:glycosyltransferase involved in cell wall biosynthesis